MLQCPQCSAVQYWRRELQWRQLEDQFKALKKRFVQKRKTKAEKVLNATNKIKGAKGTYTKITAKLTALSTQDTENRIPAKCKSRDLDFSDMPSNRPTD